MNDDHKAGQAARTTQLWDEADSTPRSEVPSALDSSTLDTHTGTSQSGSQNPDHGYFSPRPLRLYSTRLPTQLPNSTDPSPTTGLDASTSSVPSPSRVPAEQAHAPAHQIDRPVLQRDPSSTPSVATVRAFSTDPIHPFSTPSGHQRDGPHYPNQSYAALQSQHYPPAYPSHILRARSSHPSHYSSHSVSHFSTFGPPHEHRDIMDSGSRTVGNSPASSPGLFSPSTPPLRHTQRTPDEQGYYSSPYLHHTHRQIPKETHVADIDVDPISGRKIINQYEVIDELGRGVHGKVKLGRNLETGVYVAIKIVDRYSKRRRLGKNTSHADKIKKEIAILKKARHPNIVSLLEVIDDPTRKKVYIVLEHVELGEVKWRTPGTKEVVLVEWRRYQREAEGLLDDEGAALEDERIIALAHATLERQQQRRLRDRHNQPSDLPGISSWSFEHGGDSGDEMSDNGRSSRASAARPGDLSQSLTSSGRLPGHDGYLQDNMNTAFRSSTPTAGGPSQAELDSMFTGLEGTMYGPYDNDSVRGRTPSLTGSSSSHPADLDEFDKIPEHFHYVPLMTIAAAREAFRDTVLGLEYLHFQGVIHRDIKPANLLQTKERRIKISDFGVSYLGRQSSEPGAGDASESDAQEPDEAIELAKTVGTPAFYAPELCHTDIDEDTPRVSGQIDVWALGVTLYCLIFGRVPFHDNNTFVLMKLISDTEVHIPHYRLKAVEEKSSSRPTSHGRLYPHMNTDRRAPHTLEYEEVDHNLRDLLERLLIKDPENRISIGDIKRHPWLLEGIPNTSQWIEETDPMHGDKANKIEVSKDDVEKAVVPITLIDRVRSGVRKTLDTVLRIGTRGGSRRRAQSSATTPDQQNQPLSSVSSSSTISQESRRPSLAINQSIFEALRLSREPEHPLSQSVTASPEPKERPQYFERTPSRSGSPARSESAENPGPLTASMRPLALERAHSTMSASTMSSAASVRTIRQSDVGGSDQVFSPPIPPALPGTPTALDTPGGSSLGGIFGGVPRRLVNSMRSRERLLKTPPGHIRTKSIDRLVIGDDDPHGGPSIALSNTLAAGHVDQPDVLKDLSSSVGHGSTSRDSYFGDSLERSMSRQSSISSASSRYNRTRAAYDGGEVPLPHGGNAYPFPPLSREPSKDKFNQAKDELLRNRGREEKPHLSTLQPPVSSHAQAACPLSPDDHTHYERQKLDDLFRQEHPSQYPPDSSSISYPTGVDFARARALASSSSDDHFSPSMTPSTSNPSIPSVISANSSVAPDDGHAKDYLQEHAPSEARDHPARDVVLEDFTGYDGDDPVESDEDDDSEDDFIVMTKKKSNVPVNTRTGSISNPELPRDHIRRDILSGRRRSTRSGSNGTVKKIRSSEDSGIEDFRERSPEN
ncbi:kinase-like protein [Delitschia confertaspora ATCC 74209]|uniref:non-specific serine/threonine protein kinase n=1 Tax=Delitschia confertaspora ATCC 74209 TaxID=1513339 RepID=A0A9P4MUT5_9PLEO|nr:kinase-like protein [Delitschia confertaspora ATCC 74209]